MIAKLAARAFALGLALPLTMISASWAADQTIALTLGAESALALQRPYKTVLIGDPDIVDVHTRNDRSVMLEPLNPGATNLIFVDEKSIAITNVRVVVCSAGAVRIKFQAESDCE